MPITKIIFVSDLDGAVAVLVGTILFISESEKQTSKLLWIRAIREILAVDVD